MRKKYSNQLFLKIKELGYEPIDFKVTEDITEELPSKILQFRDTPFYFTIRNETNSFDLFDYKYTIFAPNYPDSDYSPSSGFAYFDLVLQGFNDWIKTEVKEYLYEETEPDLWDNYNMQDKSLNFENINFEDLESFTNQEKSQILMSINELKLLIHKEIVTSDKEQLLINARLDYLIEATERLNKYDWKGLVISTLIGITTTLTLDTQKGQLLIELFKRIFNSLPKLP
jgi:hypothetical protein